MSPAGWSKSQGWRYWKIKTKTEIISSWIWDLYAGSEHWKQNVEPSWEKCLKGPTLFICCGFIGFGFYRWMLHERVQDDVTE